MWLQWRHWLLWSSCLVVLPARLLHLRQVTFILIAMRQCTLVVKGTSQHYGQQVMQHRRVESDRSWSQMDSFTHAGGGLTDCEVASIWRQAGVKYAQHTWQLVIVYWLLPPSNLFFYVDIKPLCLQRVWSTWTNAQGSAVQFVDNLPASGHTDDFCRSFQLLLEIKP